MGKRQRTPAMQTSMPHQTMKTQVSENDAYLRLLHHAKVASIPYAPKAAEVFQHAMSTLSHLMTRHLRHCKIATKQTK